MPFLSFFPTISPTQCTLSLLASPPASRRHSDSLPKSISSLRSAFPPPVSSSTPPISTTFPPQKSCSSRSPSSSSSPFRSSPGVRSNPCSPPFCRVRFLAKSSCPDSSLPNSVACVFAVLYYIYDNSVLNVDPEGASLCDRNALPTGSSHLTEKLRLKAGAHAMGVKEETLKKCVWCVWLTNSLITRMISKLGVIKTTRRNPAIVVGTSCSLHRSSTRPLPLAQISDILRCPTTH